MRDSLETEQCICGCLIIEPIKVAPVIFSKVSEDDFYYEVYRNIFKTIKKISNSGNQIDLMIVLNAVLNEYGDDYRAPLQKAAELVPTAAHVESYIKMIKDLSVRRKTYAKALEIIEEMQYESEISTIQNTAVKLCEMLNTTENNNCVSPKDGFMQFYERKTLKKEYIKTGFLKLDNYVFIDKGNYIIIGARPSAGKTALTLQMMLEMSKEKNVVYFSLETSSEGIVDRLMSAYNRISMDEIMRQEIKPEGWTKIAKSGDTFNKLKFNIVEASGWTVQQIKAKAVQLKADVIFIDYISLIKSDGKSLYERTSNISVELHTMAQQSKIAIIALSQLNREGKEKPDMTNLRESGQLEQDADVILLLQNMDDKADSDRKLIIAKNKVGKCGAIDLSFNGQHQRFAERY